ncbi:alpha/beta fold hydrolase [Glycomyces arizonensis]|uniref:alpha/beta fold hydrolase n=1 Tax=Glycomyces arizonensis TaxID=256035 RepID=UPI0003F74C38|nr:alpha/beta hydrolase [Glycomyces arizonensis]
MTISTLAVNGAAIDYERRGSGPPLLLIPGGAGHGGVFGPSASYLADRYDVVAMSSRVASGAAPGGQDPETHAEDALGLIEALFDEPPIVFGSSSGAITALALSAHARLTVVHEPPLVNLLPDADRHRAALESVRDALREEGPSAAMPLLAAALAAEPVQASPELRHTGDWLDGYTGTEPEPPTPELVELFARLGELQPVFLEHVLVPFATHAFDLEALGAVVPAAGIDSRGELPYRATAALADRLGLPLTEFPGGHLGPVERPAQFADAFKALIGES